MLCIFFHVILTKVCKKLLLSWNKCNFEGRLTIQLTVFVYWMWHFELCNVLSVFGHV